MERHRISALRQDGESRVTRRSTLIGSGAHGGGERYYLQPLERARACFCQYGFHCNPDNANETERVRSLYLDASQRAIGMGGLFTTPYGPWADMVYSRTAGYTAVMKIVKDALDPNHILNPGKLCF